MGLFNKFFGESTTKETTTAEGLNWQVLDSQAGLQEIIRQSSEKPQIIFKHSTRCHISAMVKRGLERTWDIDAETATIHYLDLIRYRPISNQIASDFGVRHESPQILIIKDGVSVYDTSHNDISVDKIREVV